MPEEQYIYGPPERFKKAVEHIADWRVDSAVGMFKEGKLLRSELVEDIASVGERAIQFYACEQYLQEHHPNLEEVTVGEYILVNKPIPDGMRLYLHTLASSNEEKDVTTNGYYSEGTEEIPQGSYMVEIREDGP